MQRASAGQRQGPTAGMWRGPPCPRVLFHWQQRFCGPHCSRSGAENGLMSFRTYRRRLPHWRLEGATYFVTWRLHRVQRPLDPEERDHVVATIRHFDSTRYALSAFVVMDDHVHVVVTPSQGVELERIVHSWKSHTAWRLQRECARSGPVWQDEYYDRVLRNEAEVLQKIRYILNNPGRRWPGFWPYPWLWARGQGTPSEPTRCRG